MFYLDQIHLICNNLIIISLLLCSARPYNKISIKFKTNLQMFLGNIR